MGLWVWVGWGEGVRGAGAEGSFHIVASLVIMMLINYARHRVENRIEMYELRLHFQTRCKKKEKKYICIY